MSTRESKIRLDASEQVWFQRQLEAVDQQLYEIQFPELKARGLIPTQGGIPDWAKVYTWRMFEKLGRAKVIANMAEDIPRVGIQGAEQSKVIKPVAASYGWDIFEIKAAAATNVPLDSMEAMAGRYAIEQTIDQVLALGLTSHNLGGLLTQTGVTAYTPITKTGGGTTWANATPDEIIKDLAGIGAAIRSALKGANAPQFQKFTIILPIDQYSLAASTRMGDGSDTTILKFALENIPWIEEIVDWVYADNAAGVGVDRMVCYPKTPFVVAGIVPLEFETQPAQQRGLEQVVDALATTGGVVVRYPVAIGYGDGI